MAVNEEKRRQAVKEIFNMLARLPDEDDQFKMLRSICFFNPELISEPEADKWCREHASFVCRKYLKS